MTHDHEKQYQRRKRLKIYGISVPIMGLGRAALYVYTILFILKQ